VLTVGGNGNAGDTKKKKTKNKNKKNTPTSPPQQVKTGPGLECPQGTGVTSVDDGGGGTRLNERKLAVLPKCKTKCRTWRHDPQKERCISICVVNGCKTKVRTMKTHLHSLDFFYVEPN